jgi:DNA sulfur modification protein DndD
VRLQSLTLENFRQFYGRQTITFSEHPDKNVTVIYAPNGGGKTALLNAFTWALYKETTAGFEQPDALVNFRALHEAAENQEVTARVVLVFEHEGNVYTVERVTTVRKQADGRTLRVRDAAATVTFVDESGRTNNRSDNEEGTINQILPKRLHNFFFFNGERIEHLVGADSYEEIEDAIKTILGLTIVERSIKHLDEARKALEKELAAVGSDELRTIQAELDAAREQRERKLDERKEISRNRTANQADLDAVENRLETLDDAADLQRRRKELEDAQTQTQHEISLRRDSLASRVSQAGFLAFGGNLVDKIGSTYDELREKGEIPTDLKLQFVEDLLEQGKCICGSPLHQGEPPYESVASWRQKAGRKDVEEAWMQLSASAKQYVTRREELFAYLHETMKERADLRETEKNLDDKLGEIKGELDEIDSEEVQGLERRREELRSAIRKADIDTAIITRDVSEFDKRISELERDFDAAGTAIAKAQVAQRRVVVAREARDTFSEILTLRTNEVRQQLDERVRHVYSKIAFKNYVPVLDDRFRLELRSKMGDDGVPVPKSTGENQTLSLSFVGALAEHARTLREAASGGRADPLLSFQGGIFPIVMDSPFGSLDENYQRDVAEWLPQLAPQVVIFVTKSQGQHAVKDKLLPKVGREYVIGYRTPKAGEEQETIELRAGTFPYIEPVDGDAEWAEIQEA